MSKRIFRYIAALCLFCTSCQHIVPRIDSRSDNDDAAFTSTRPHTNQKDKLTTLEEDALWSKRSPASSENDDLKWRTEGTKDFSWPKTPYVVPANSSYIPTYKGVFHSFNSRLSSSFQQFLDGLPANSNKDFLKLFAKRFEVEHDFNRISIIKRINPIFQFYSRSSDGYGSRSQAKDEPSLFPYTYNFSTEVDENRINNPDAKHWVGFCDSVAYGQADSSLQKLLSSHKGLVCIIPTGKDSERREAYLDQTEFTELMYFLHNPNLEQRDRFYIDRSYFGVNDQFSMHQFVLPKDGIVNGDANAELPHDECWSGDDVWENRMPEQLSFLIAETRSYYASFRAGRGSSEYKADYDDTYTPKDFLRWFETDVKESFSRRDNGGIGGMVLEGSAGYPVWNYYAHRVIRKKEKEDTITVRDLIANGKQVKKWAQNTGRFEDAEVLQRYLNKIGYVYGRHLRKLACLKTDRQQSPTNRDVSGYSLGAEAVSIVASAKNAFEAVVADAERNEEMQNLLSEFLRVQPLVAWEYSISFKFQSNDNFKQGALPSTISSSSKASDLESTRKVRYRVLINSKTGQIAQEYPGQWLETESWEKYYWNKDAEPKYKRSIGNTIDWFWIPEDPKHHKLYKTMLNAIGAGKQGYPRLCGPVSALHDFQNILNKIDSSSRSAGKPVETPALRQELANAYTLGKIGCIFGDRRGRENLEQAYPSGVSSYYYPTELAKISTPTPADCSP